MCDKTKIGFVRNAVDSDMIGAILNQLEETHPGKFEIVELEEQPMIKCPPRVHPFDTLCFKPETLAKTLNVITRQPFRLKHRDRIDRYNRVWPRHGAPMLTWNRNLKWLPRFYDSPRKSYFSQSQLRRSQVMSWHPVLDIHPHTVCSLEDLDLSRWP